MTTAASQKSFDANKLTHTTNYVVGIDGCRALACIGVFIVNYLNKVSFDSGGNYFDIGVISGRFGIVTLIVLSGFGLSIPFWRSLIFKEPWPSTLKFLVRRFFRIAPLYYICLTALIIHNQIWQEVGGWKDILLHFSFLHNYSNGSYYSINSVFWVLPFFIHFYIILPALFWFGKGGAKTACIVFSAVIVFAYCVHYYISSLAEASGIDIQNRVMMKSFLAYLPHFLIGTLCGCLYLQRQKSGAFEKLSRLGRASFWILIVVFIVALGTPLAQYGELPYSVYHFPVTPILIALLILSAAAGSASTLLESLPVKTLALLSYGIFIFHYPVINLSLRYLPKISIDPLEHIYLTGVFAFAITSLIAAIAYIFIEKPVNSMTRKLFI